MRQHTPPKKFKDVIEFFDRELADSLVYELYLKGKFHENGLCLEPKEYLLEAVSRHLRSKNYDRWPELYWKKQLEEDLTPEEQRELEKIEKDVHKSLKEEQNWIYKTKSHDWIKKTIEGGS